MKLGKQEIVNKYSELKGISKKEAEQNFDDIIDVIKSSLSEGNDVGIFGFGNFEIKETVAREGRNPRTGEVIQIPAGKRIGFKASKKLKELV